MFNIKNLVLLFFFGGWERRGKRLKWGKGVERKKEVMLDFCFISILKSKKQN